MKKLIAIALIAPALANAEFLSGNDLLQRINGEGSYPMFALGYIAGISDVNNGTLVCPTSSVTLGQMKDMVRNHLNDNPQFRHFTADVIVLHVLKAAFPCKQTGQQI